MKRNRIVRKLAGAAGVFGLLALLWSLAAVAHAQQSAGSVTGIVTDASGSVIPGANVTVRNIDQGTSWVTQTTSAGLYNFPVLPVGRVDVKVSAPGFATEVRNPFTLVLNQVARVDFHLKVGNVKQTVTVTDIPPLLQTGSTELGTLIDAKAANSLPLATRDINQLTLLAPGVLSSNIFAFESPQTTFGTGRPYVNGAREQDNNFILDGMDDNQPDNDEVSYSPAPDAIQEFNIIVSNAPADYGNYAGGVIVESIKSGTNQFHGDLYEYLRNTDLNANTWQDKANGFLVGYPSSVLPRPGVQWNEFGGMVGGPIVKNKLFFFADEENSIYNRPSTSATNSLMPSPSFYTPSNGKVSSQVIDLGYFCQQAGGTFNSSGMCSAQNGQLYMPSAGVAPASRPIIPYNQIPVGSLDPVAKAVIALPEFQNEVYNAPTYLAHSFTHTYQGDIKVDWQASQNDHIEARYTQMWTLQNNTNGVDVLQPDMQRQYPLKNIVFDYVRTLTPTLVNEFRVGANIFPANDQIYTPATSGNINGTIGLQGVPVDGLPQIDEGYGAGAVVGGTYAPEDFHDTTYQLDDSLTWTHGRHSIHTGFEWLHFDMNDLYAGNNGAGGEWKFSGQYTGNTGASGPTPYADFLLGMPSEIDVGQPIHFNLVNSLGAGFVQDNYQATPNLTLNIGVRYEVNTPRGDRNSKMNINYDLVTGQPEVGKNYDTYWGAGDIEPRFGFAWQPKFAPHTVVRGAYDISSFMEGNGIGNMAVLNPPNTNQIQAVNAPGTDLPSTTLSQGYTPYFGATSACTASALIALSPACLAGVQTHATDPHLRPAMNQQWNLTVQHQFGASLTTSVGYVGNRDIHMADIYWYRQSVLSNGSQSTPIKDEWGNLFTPPNVVPGPYMQNLNALGLGINPRYNASDAVATYDALEASAALRNFHGFDAQVNFTWSRNLTNSLGYFGVYGDEEGAGEQQNNAGGNFFQNEYDPMGDYGRSTIDAAAAFNAYVLYNLPFGRGKAYGANVSKAVDELIGGWNLSLDDTMRSGFAITPYDGEWFGSFNPAGASNLTAPGSYVPRADCNPGVSPNMSMTTVQIGDSIGRVNLNPAYVSPQQDGRFGTCKVGAMRGPSLMTADLNLNKTFSLAGTTNLVFMAQFVNLTNTPIFSVPASWQDIYSECIYCTGIRTTGPNGGGPGTVGSYGLLDGSNPGRQIELSLKLNF